MIKEALGSMITLRSEYRCFHLDFARFETVSKVVDILLDQKTSIGNSLGELEIIKAKLDGATS